MVRREVEAPEGMPSVYLPWLAYQRHGWDVHVFYLGNFRPDELKELNFAGCHIHPVGRSDFFTKMNRRKILRMRAVADCRFLFDATLRQAEVTPPAFIYTLMPWLSPAVTKLAKRFPAVTVKRVYGSWLYFDWTHGSLWKRLLCLPHFLMMRWPVDCFILSNDGTNCDKLMELLRVPREKYFHWMNGVSKEYTPPGDGEKLALKAKLGLPPDSFVLLALSRLSRWKRQDRLVRMFAAVHERMPDARLVLAGGGNMEAELRALAGELGIADKVIFPGIVKHADVPTYMGIADIFYQTNDLSCLGNSLLEAVVCGCCAVTWDVGTTRDLIKDGVNGLLLPDAQPSTLADVTWRLYNSPEARRKLAAGARNYALNVLESWDVRLDKEIALVGELYQKKFGAKP